MAAQDPVKSICDEIACPLCLEYFKDPVTIDCGHNFCQACLTQYWRESNTESSCPQCRETVQQRNFRPNRQLANVVQLVKKLQEGKKDEGKRGVCERHQEPLKLFCKNDQAPICVVCDRSKEHQAHSVFPMEEASQEYKEKIKAHLESLKEKKEKLKNQKLTEELGKQECLTRLELEKQKVRSAFEGMQKFLEEKQHFWLSQLGDLQKEMEKRQEENLTKLSEGIFRLNKVITEMEGKCLQSACEFLQDFRNTLSRCEKNLVGHEVDLSPHLEERLRIYSKKNCALEKAMENYKVSLEQALNTVNVTLDPETAHPCLILSKDQNCVRRGNRQLSLPDNPERFDQEAFVLGCEKFTSGSHWWEVDVWGEAGWAVGVARDSVSKKGKISLHPSEGIWAVGTYYMDACARCNFEAYTAPGKTSLTLRRVPRKIQVSLDYEGGYVEFFDADTNEFIFTFHSGSFCGEIIRPFFKVCCDVSLKC